MMHPIGRGLCDSLRFEDVADYMLAQGASLPSDRREQIVMARRIHKGFEYDYLVL